MTTVSLSLPAHPIPGLTEASRTQPDGGILGDGGPIADAGVPDAGPPQSGQALYLRQLDFTNPATRAFTDIPGPGSNLPLNTRGCEPSHPEIANTDGTIYVTWAEECASGSWTVKLASVQ